MLIVGDNMKITSTLTIASTSSTNDYLKTRQNDICVGTLVRAIKQTKGRGRRGTVWHAEEGKNLTFSFLLEGDIDASRRVLMASALAVVATLKNIGIISSIKLPNDIYVGDHKIAGILIETTTYHERPCIVCGIGLNVNEPEPTRYDEKATSLTALTNKSYDIESLLEGFKKVFNDIIENPNLFRDFKEEAQKRLHLVSYLHKTHQLVDFTPDFTCTIQSEKDVVDVPCEQLTFSLK